jgi:hypothetical protein
MNLDFWFISNILQHLPINSDRDRTKRIDDLELMHGVSDGFC